jgi:hypothetical protein
MLGCGGSVVAYVASEDDRYHGRGGKWQHRLLKPPNIEGVRNDTGFEQTTCALYSQTLYQVLQKSDRMVEWFNHSVPTSHTKETYTGTTVSA